MSAATLPSLEDLLRAAATGDRQGFAQLYAATSAQLFGTVLRILKRRALAEEVVQESYLAIWNRAGDFQAEKGAALTWMLVIARHRAIDRLRRRRPETPIDAAPEAMAMADAAPSPLANAIAAAERRALQACLDELEGEQKQSLLLAYYEGLTHEEVAARIGAPLGTVKSWIRRGLIRLKGCLAR
jgi:RNA polymerase sigma-70 factor (ECF subfamily)